MATAQTAAPQKLLTVEEYLQLPVNGAPTELTLGESFATPKGNVAFALASPGAWVNWPTDLTRPAYRFGFRRA